MRSGYLTDAERNAYEPGCFTWAPDKVEWACRAGRSWREPGWRQKDSEPVVCISWTDAQPYDRWLDQNRGVKGWRLPTEAEWHYAARAGSTTRRPWGDEPDAVCGHSNGTDRTKGPNGRAHETQDCRGRVVRGGGWDDPSDMLCSAERFWQGSGNRNHNIGLRVARALPPGEQPEGWNAIDTEPLDERQVERTLVAVGSGAAQRRRRTS